MFKIITVILVVAFFSCNQDSTRSEYKTLDFGAFTIEVPSSWKKIEMQGVDSYVGGIVTDARDTLSFDLGWYSNKLYEGFPYILDSSSINSIDTNVVDINSIIFVKDGHKIDPDKYIKNNISWDTVDGYKAKIVFPRKSGTGTTGIYIDSLWKSGSGIDKFNLYGEDLGSNNEKQLLKSVKTIKFKKH